MSEQDIEAGRRVIASVGTVIYRWDRRHLEVLVGERQNEPWKGYSMIAFGGGIDPDDFSVESAARREALEETGRGLEFLDGEFLHHYGPRSFHHRIYLDAQNAIQVVRTEKEISEKYKFVAAMFCAECIGGEPRDNDEVKHVRFEDVLELARMETKLAFEQALVLRDAYLRLVVFPNFSQ
ncbi:MAG: hypothetical protein A2945_03785 [Candidatus Liptonbacteria bacterium RIFCSPLOWO2_01_FULL_52_25]|uniref:Nudix hydrolase domain-containing protein n=1 Tax=Candidatus Liptonbacteria bacterium RIFCSPLOWO2_01_FULL_52_25 TaxID=1798650 RepID=A0A1G2CGB6_9BACT|nr:MAG: hypothetical protein A2945_03785 [Candidatus Liptonbacteria bacterium RIFCSPLOWO2_01_FULL_52_25]